MAAKLESLSDLQSWNDYRDFMKERLKQVPAEACPFFVSKEKIDFDEGGKTWKGFAVLVGPKGHLAVKQIKKEGVMFREGVCTLSGKEFQVDGIQSTLVKQAHLTLKRLKLGYSVVGAEDDDEDEAAAGEQAAGAAQGDELAARQSEATAAIKEAASLREPANDAVLKQAAKALQGVPAATAKGDAATAGKLLDMIEDLLTQVVEGPEASDGADPDLAGLGDWGAYRDFTKAQLKRMPPEGGAFWVSRKKVDFDIDGKPYKNYVVLLGKESKIKPTVQALKKDGTLMFEGTCIPEGKTLKVSGIKPEVLKGAMKLFIKLRLGRKIVAGEELSADAESGSANGAFREAWAAAAASWHEACATVEDRLEALRTKLRSSGDPELVDIANSGLFGITTPPALSEAIEAMSSADGSAAPSQATSTKQALAQYVKFLTTDERIKACDSNPFGVTLGIRATLTPALNQLNAAL